MDEFKKRTTVTDIISIKEINTWRNEDCITIETGCGKGKSHWVKYVLYEVAKKANEQILFLIHRRNALDQFDIELDLCMHKDYITIMSYQKLEYMTRKDYETLLSSYKYIVADEAHYFLDDKWNKFTNISFNEIMSSGTVKIFMSATINYIKSYINNFRKIETKDYSLPINFDFIRHLTFTYQSNAVIGLIEECIRENKKGLFFINNIEQAIKLYHKYNDYCTFNCSKSNKYYKSNVDPDTIKQILATQRFDSLIFITTSVFDAGVNLIMPELNTIYIDTIDPHVLIQELGRKRIMDEKNDYVDLYVLALSKSKINGLKGTCKSRIEMAEHFKMHGLTSFMKAYEREVDNSYIVYDELGYNGTVEKKLNELMYFKSKLEIADYDFMQSYEQNGYCEFISRMLNKPYSIREHKKREKDIKQYILDNKNKLLFKEQQDELKQVIRLTDKRGRLQTSIDLLSLYLIKNYNYSIVPKITKKDNRKYTTWVIQELA